MIVNYNLYYKRLASAYIRHVYPKYQLTRTCTKLFTMRAAQKNYKNIFYTKSLILLITNATGTMRINNIQIYLII